MESVMVFLSENYLYFFIAAIVLCFALIGFLIDSSRKKKNEFKGESIVEEKTPEAPVVAEEPIASAEVTEVASLDAVEEIAPVSEVEQTITYEPVIESTPVAEAPTEPVVSNDLDNTMEINDIPMNETPVVETFAQAPVSYETEQFEIEELSLDEVPEINSEETVNNSELEDLNNGQF